MPVATIPEADFVRLMKELGPAKTAKRLKIGIRRVYDRRARIEHRTGRRVEIPEPRSGELQRRIAEYPHRKTLDIDTGVVLIGGDLHAWPGKPSTAFRAFVKFVKLYKPRAIILNGDMIDGAKISRHAPIGWEKRPTLIEEIETCQERLGEIENCAPRGCQLYWTLGNHDSRFESRIALVAPEFAAINGVHLKDHFPAWTPCWSVWVNDVVVKHRFRSGIHATHNNVMWAGKTIVTNHLHSAKVTPLTDYNGTRYGVDTGCLADSDGAAFVDYTEDPPKNWREGFAFLTFRKHRLMYPELVLKVDSEHVEFRGDIVRV